MQQALADLDRKTNKAQIAHSLDELAGQLDQRRNHLRQRLIEHLTAGPPLLHPGAFASRMLGVRSTATVVALLSVWWQVLVEEATRFRTEPDFELRLVSDLGVSEGRRVHRYAVILASDAARTAHGVVLSVRATEQLIREREELEEQLAPTSPDPSPDRRRLRPPGLLELEELLSARLDTRVKVEMGAKKGKMNIEFANLEDLERIYRIINSSTT